MLEILVRLLLLPFRSENIKDRDNQQGVNKMYTKQELETMYKVYGSIGKVAAFLNKSYSTVRHWYHINNIETQVSCMNMFHEIRNTPMSNYQKSVVLGSLLGDGNLRLAPHSKNAILRIGHCEKQLNYLLWKNKILKPFSRNVVLDQREKIKFIKDVVCHSTNFYKFNTIAHPDITTTYKQYVKDHKKTVNNAIVDELDPISLAIWFADDGSVVLDKRTNALTCSIATNSFSYKEQLILIGALQKFFDGTIQIAKQGNKDRDDVYLRLFNTKSIIKFLNPMLDILPECIHYKFNPQRLMCETPIKI
jgi:hypothetical protein